MNIPPFIKKGDTIALTATARKISRDELSVAIAMIENKGFKVKLAPHLFAEQNQFAGGDEVRSQDLQELINDTEVKAIIIVRGGYGTMRIIDHIDFGPLNNKPKWIIGYSDVTVLHSALNNINVASLHATMPINFSKNKEATDSLFNFLEGAKICYEYDYTHSVNVLYYKKGIIKAPVVGGNLSLLHAMQGSKTDIDTKGKILFLEDLDEYLYHIDRMILSLKRAGKFDELAGLIIGGMSDMKDNAVPFGQTAEQIIYSHLREANFPICFDFPCGHIELNMALPFGIAATFEVNEHRVSLSYT